MATDSAASSFDSGARAREGLQLSRWASKQAGLNVKTSGLGKPAAACRAPGLPAQASETPLNPGPTASLSDFVQCEEIYRGRETRIIRCLAKLTRMPVVVKISAKAGMTARQRELVEREVRLARTLTTHRHPGLLALHNSFEDSHNVYQVLEYCNQGNLYDALHADGLPFSEEEVCTQVIRPLLSTLAFIHSHNIVHRDVKLENLLLANGRLKLADFGLAVDLAEEEPRLRVGTIDYNAPEVTVQPSARDLERLGADAVPAYGPKVDVWAAGVAAYELLLGRPPFYTPDAGETAALIREGPLAGFLGFLSPECVDFLQAALRKDPEERPSASELLSHPWLAFYAPEAGPCDPKPDSPEEDSADSLVASSYAFHTLRTFETPNPSLSPRLGSWKIQSSALGEARPGSAASATDPLGWRSPRVCGSRLQKEASRDCEDLAEDVQPKAAPARLGCGPHLPHVPSYVEAAPDLEILREEVAESAFGAPLAGNPGAEAIADSSYLVPAQLRRTLSVGRTRFA